MAHLAGRGGALSIEDTLEAGIRSWTLDYTVDMLDTSDFEDGQTTEGARTFLPGLSSWSGTFEGLKDTAPYALTFSSTTVTLWLEEVDAGAMWIGEAFITGVHANTSVDGVITYTYDFQGTGILTESAA